MQGGLVAVYYYKKSSGKIPVLDFIDSLPLRDKEKILFDLTLLRDRGIHACGLSLRHIEGKLWEIRFKLSAGYRIFYCMISLDVHLLHAYKKQGQKAPAKEVDIATKRMMEVLR